MSRRSPGWWGAAAFASLLALVANGSRSNGPVRVHEIAQSTAKCMDRLASHLGLFGPHDAVTEAAEVESNDWSDTDGEGHAFHRVAHAGESIRMALPGGGVLRHADRVVVDLRAPFASDRTPLEFEIAFYDDAQRNRWWRSVRLADSDWQSIEISLPYLRYDRGAVPLWENVTSWGVTVRSGAEVHVGAIEAWRDSPEGDAYLGPEELVDSFPHPERVREASEGAFVVLTDAPDLELEPVLDALVQMQERVAERFPELSVPDGSVPLLVFSSSIAYRSFWSAFNIRAGTSAKPLPEDQGYTWLGIATASYSDAYGPVRPIYVHEASHALLERGLGVDAQRSWLFEGLGNLEQLQVSGQDISAVYRAGLASAFAKAPVQEMVAGRPISTDHYWQATLLLEWLLSDPQRAEALSECLVDMRFAGSVDLRPLIEHHFGFDTARFAAEFWRWARDHYAADT